MGDVSVQHVDRKIVGRIASTALGHEGEIPGPVEARARKGRARNSQGSGENETHEKRSRCTVEGPPHSVAHDYSLCCLLLGLKPAKTLTVLVRFHRGHGVFFLAPAPSCRGSSRG